MHEVLEWLWIAAPLVAAYGTNMLILCRQRLETEKFDRTDSGHDGVYESVSIVSVVSRRLCLKFQNDGHVCLHKLMI